MPIYEYRCSDCGFKDEYLQKVSEPPMTVCPTCGKPSFVKLVSAAGFQLKGSGWYATDFRNGSKASAKAAEAPKASAESKGGSATESKSESTTTESKSAAKSEAAPA